MNNRISLKKLGHRQGLSRRSMLKALGVGGLAVANLGSVRADSGKLVVYSTTLPPIQKRLTEAFTRKTGITVQSLRLVNNPLAQRFVAEQRAQQYICDVITLGLDVFYDDLSNQGLLADIDDVPGVSTLPAEFRPGRQYVNLMYGPLSIGYNAKSLTGNAIPRGWQDLIKSEFAGKIIMPDPRANDSIVAFVDMLHRALGDDYIRRLGRQKPKLVPAVPQGVEQVIAGEGQIILPCLAMNLIQYEGTNAPVAITPTPSPSQGTYFYTGIAANAPHKAAARQWLAFVLSPEGQEIICKDNGVSPLGRIPGSLAAPESLEKIDLTGAMSRAAQLYDLLGLAA